MLKTATLMDPVEIDLSQADDADVSPSVSDSHHWTRLRYDDGIDGTTHTVLVSDSANDGSASITVTVTYEHDKRRRQRRHDRTMTPSNDGVTFDISASILVTHWLR